MMRVGPALPRSLLGQVMSTNESEHKSVLIGILGVFPLLLNPFFRLTAPKALQGAFIEHQVMLQKLTSSLQIEISVDLVRSVQDLHTCDALVIPGGGMLLHSDVDILIHSVLIPQNRQRLLSSPKTRASLNL